MLEIMAYIPTIHTFEDDVNENRGVEEAPIIGGIEKITNDSSILVQEDSSNNLSKRILILFSIIFLLGSVGLVGYYFYNKNKIQREEAAALREALDKEAVENTNANFANDLIQIFNRSGEGMSSYLKSAVKRNNIIILTIKEEEGKDNYSSLYAYILAHKKDVGSDLFDAFGLDDISQEEYKDETISDSISSSISTTSSSSIKTTLSTSSNIVSNTIKDFNNILDKMYTPVPISGKDLAWEAKTINNQDIEIANAGVITLIYGYVGKEYLIFTTSLKDFFDTSSGLK
jgi:hypothetical protein